MICRDDIYILMYTYIYIHMCVCVCVCMYDIQRRDIHPNTLINVYIYKCMCTRTQIQGGEDP